jgi:hypothetical protein
MPTINDGQQAVEQGNLQQARLIFEAILQENKRDVDAWLGLADVLTDSEDKRVCYENVLKLDKGNRRAKDGLRNLEPQANPFVEALGTPGAEGDTFVDDVQTPTIRHFLMTPRWHQMIRVTRQLLAVKQLPLPTGGPPTTALVAMGLVLSVVVFAVGGGVIYVILSTLAG